VSGRNRVPATNLREYSNTTLWDGKVYGGRQSRSARTAEHNGCGLRLCQRLVRLGRTESWQLSKTCGHGISRRAVLMPMLRLL